MKKNRKDLPIVPIPDDAEIDDLLMGRTMGGILARRNKLLEVLGHHAPVAVGENIIEALRPFAELLEYPDEATDGGMVTVTVCAEDIRRAIDALASLPNSQPAQKVDEAVVERVAVAMRAVGIPRPNSASWRLLARVAIAALGQGAPAVVKESVTADPVVVDEPLTQACTNCGLLYGCTCVPCKITINEPSDAGKEVGQ